MTSSIWQFIHRLAEHWTFAYGVRHTYTNNSCEWLIRWQFVFSFFHFHLTATCYAVYCLHSFMFQSIWIHEQFYSLIRQPPNKNPIGVGTRINRDTPWLIQYYYLLFIDFAFFAFYEVDKQFKCKKNCRYALDGTTQEPKHLNVECWLLNVECCFVDASAFVLIYSDVSALLWWPCFSCRKWIKIWTFHVHIVSLLFWIIRNSLSCTGMDIIDSIVSGFLCWSSHFWLGWSMLNVQVLINGEDAINNCECHNWCRCHERIP